MVGQELVHANSGTQQYVQLVIKPYEIPLFTFIETIKVLHSLCLTGTLETTEMSSWTGPLFIASQTVIFIHFIS